MDSPQYQPDTPLKLVPDWALKLTSAPKVETPTQKRQPPPNAPKAPAAMCPALPRNVRSKRGGQNRTTPHKSPPPAVSIVDFAVSTPTRQKFQPVVAPDNETVANEKVVAMKEDRDVSDEYAEELLRKSTGKTLRWNPLDVKEFVPQYSTLKNGGEKRIDTASAISQTWVGGSRQQQQKRHFVYPQHFPSNNFFEEIDLDAWEERKRQYRRQRQAEITPIGCTLGKQGDIWVVAAKKKVDTFEYSPAQQKKDYALLLQDSEADEIDPVYGLSYAPKFEYWSAWRDEFTDRFLCAVRAEHAQMSYLLDEAFETVQQSGLSLGADVMEEVKKMVEVGHDFSQQGSRKFNEHMVNRTRSKMMQQAGAWRRIFLGGEKHWFTGE